MCVVCVTVAGTVLVTSQVVPIEVLSNFTTSQRTISSFTGTSQALNRTQQAEIKAIVAKNPNANSVVCTGLTTQRPNKNAITAASNRAKAVCRFAQSLNPSFETSVQTRSSNLRSNAGKVSISLRTAKGTATSPTDMTYIEPSQATDPVELCKIEEASAARALYGDEKNNTKAGFPVSRRTPNTGVVKWALIPIEFTDLRGESNFRTRIDSQMSLLSEWFEVVSGGKFKVEWVVLDRWATLPGKSSDYVIPKSVNVNNAPNGPKIFKDAMNAADPIFDFTGIQTVNFILPKGQTAIGEGSQGFPWDEVVQTHASNEGRVASYSIAGQYFDHPDRTYWSYWAHEFGHAIGIPHVGKSQGVQPPFNPWDLMGGQDGPSRELSGWLRFVTGWLDDSQVYCKSASQVDRLNMTLVPLSDNRTGIKMAVIPVSKTKAVIIESRRETKFSCKASPARNGVLVYVYDATLGHNEDFLIPASPANRPSRPVSSCVTAPTPDFLLRTGDKVTIEGVTVEVLKHGNLDQVLIRKS